MAAKREMANSSKFPDYFLPLGLVATLTIMIVPLPPMLLDLLLAASITFAVIILLVAMYALKPLEFSAFPSLLLIITLFRLSLNIASTRLILLNGDSGPAAAGQVIRSFGSFIVGGNYAVGLIVFAILVIINFIVITKGSGRIAEVAARFTLDAMPGKQMSIDADLTAGLIGEDDARKRRMAIAEEADFYGSMDGASKFIKGDAIAGILITLINILGGLVIGILQKGMAASDAVSTYTLLTIGDGLVSQVPALLVSTSAGIIMTHVASESHVGREMASQVVAQPKALASASLILFFFGLMPGLPHVAFLTLSSITGVVAYNTFQKKNLQAKREESKK
jgi:flagellar biosynthesis protein FlhA